jgi:hypothetical protein
MPPLPNVPNVLRADFLWSLSDDTDISTRLFLRYSGGPPSSSDAAALAADIYNPLHIVDTMWGTDTVLTGCRVTDLSSSTGGQGEHTQSTEGGRAGGELPAGVCLLANYLINRRYRGGKPRSYWPWMTSDDFFTRRAWAAESVTEAASNLAATFTAIIGLNEGTTTITQHVNVSYYSGFTVVTNPVTGRARNVPTLRNVPVVDQINSFNVSTTPASQRRRN